MQCLALMFALLLIICGLMLPFLLWDRGGVHTRHVHRRKDDDDKPEFGLSIRVGD
jgi:hypothetical protein